MEAVEKELEQVYVNQVQAAKILGIGLSTLKKWKREYKDFPRPCRVSSTAVFFRKDELEEWMEKRREE